jgi:hypothetical protein
LLLLLALPAVGLAAPEKDLTVEEFLQSLSTVPNVVSRRDPFKEAKPPFDKNAVLDNMEVTPDAPVLQRYPVSQYMVVATLLGDKYPRALVKLPSSEKGKVLIVKLRDKLGNQSGVISKILKDGIIVVQNHKSPLGFVDKSEIVLNVGVSPEDAEKAKNEGKSNAEGQQ